MNATATGKIDPKKPPRRWTGRWIWMPDEPNTPNSFYYFRHTFHLDEPIEAARIAITAETRYRLWVDDHWVGEGPPQSPLHFKYYDVHEGTLLTEGTHCVAVVVHHADGDESRGGLLLEITDEAGRVAVATGSDWKIARAGPGRSTPTGSR